MADNLKPSVTIGITAFECETSLETAVNSALNQDYAPLYVIIADDGSMDNTPRLAKTLASKHPNISFIKGRKNRGVAATRNAIVDRVKTDFIAFFDDDDISQPTRVRQQLERIMECEVQTGAELVVCHTARQVHYPNGTTRYERCLAQNGGTMGAVGPAVSASILLGLKVSGGRGACPTCSQMARTTTYRAVGGFDENLRRSEDTEFCIRAGMKGATFVGISEPLVEQKMTATSDKSLEIELENWQYVYGKHRDLIGAHTSFDFMMNWLALRHKWLAKNHMDFLLGLLKLTYQHPVRSMQRIMLSLPNAKVNWSFSIFHHRSEK
jgi:glycosyltransferase involved in cell wall biosynthesis